jgi:predicted RecA/RadA family phage recombinase
MQAKFYKRGDVIPHTFSADTTGGSLVQVADGRCGLVNADVADGESADVQVDGIIDVIKDSSDISAGDVILWDADGDPVGGTADTGAASLSGDFVIGKAIKDAGATVASVKVALNESGKQSSIADPDGGSTVDAEARTAIGSLIDALETAGILTPAS